ncbi:MAG TPA: hypothetical protein VMT88_00595 [Actinomycetes bacterium]|nr:hypothetical protein [Actinomycetes bacterium]
MVFPLVDGERSTLSTGRHVIAAATRRVDTAIHEAARDETNWRSKYVQHFRELTRLSAGQHAPLIAADGLNSVHNEFRYLRHGAELSLADALSVPRAHYVRTWTIQGNGVQPAVTDLSVPYRGQRLTGDALRRTLDAWQAQGIAEPSFSDALRTLMDNPDWLQLRDTTFVVMGAGSEMGPLRSLLSWGAHVVAVDLPDPELWQRVLAIARQSPGKLTLPIRGAPSTHSTDAQLASLAGVDILTQTPEVCAWLEQLPGPYVLGDYVYAPGSLHVRTSVAIDAIIKRLLATRSDVSLAYLATPTDAYAVPSSIVEYSQRQHKESRALVISARGLTGGRMYRPNYTTTETTSSGLRYGIADALVPQQGPNYALAKRVQRWRADLVRGHGVFVSINVAPATRTKSVIRNRLLAAAYAGAHRFGLEIFNPATSSTLMAALLAHDVANPASVAHADTPLDDPYELLVQEALHGGMWRAPYAPRSVLGLAVAMGMFQRN